MNDDHSHEKDEVSFEGLDRMMGISLVLGFIFMMFVESNKAFVDCLCSALSRGVLAFYSSASSCNDVWIESALINNVFLRFSIGSIIVFLSIGDTIDFFFLRSFPIFDVRTVKSAL